MIKVNGQKVLHFTKVLDIYEEPEEEIIDEAFNESYWQNKAPWNLENTRAFKEIVDKVYGSSELRFVKNYISITINNSIHFWFNKRSSNKSLLNFWVDKDFTEEIKSMLDEKGFTPTVKNETFRVTIDKDKILNNKSLFQDIIEKVKESW